ncbi:hypothetical protein TNCV_4881981 [Trichonephila clavipes]|nr:hypothetical protein TNCV_4881981 [Trichonephila clavipes]
MTFWNCTSTSFFGVAANEACSLCSHARMVDDHLFKCTGLYEYGADNIVSRYGEVQCQMVKKPSTGVGTSVPAVHDMMDTLGEEAPVLDEKAILNSSLNLIIVGKPPSLLSFLQ